MPAVETDAMIVQTIQLALAPVFVLVAIGNIMNILSTRLGRVVDRARVLQGRFTETEGEEHDLVVREIRMSNNRILIIGRAMRLLVSSALAIGLTVALLFIEGFAHAGFNAAAAITFMLAIALLMLALLLFLRETRQATEALRIPESYLELHRNL